MTSELSWRQIIARIFRVNRESIEMPISMGRPVCGQLQGRPDVLLKFFNKQL